MKKEECISNFVASLIIAFPFMAMFAFLVELFGIEAFIEISKNHGSLVAGLIGFGGVFWLVKSQKKESLRIIKSKCVEESVKAIIEADNGVGQLSRMIFREESDVDEVNKIFKSSMKNISLSLSLGKKLRLGNYELLLEYRSNFIVMIMLANLQLDVRFNKIKRNKKDHISFVLNNAQMLSKGEILKDSLQRCIDQYASHEDSEDILYGVFNSYRCFVSNMLMSGSAILFMLERVDIEN